MQTASDVRSDYDHLAEKAGEPNPEVLRLNQSLQMEVAARQRMENHVRSQEALLNMTSDAVIVCSLEGRIVEWNQGATRIYGWSSETANGKALSELFYPLESTNFSTNLAATIAKREHRAEENHMTSMGRTIVVQTRWSLGRNPEGKDEILIVNTDVTEQKELERQFLRMQRLETVGLLASGIAHDLNNVLAPILMASQNLLNDIKDEGQAELLRSIEASARRGGALVHQILSYARGTESERAPLDVKQLLHEFQKVAKDTFPRAIQIVTRFGKDLKPVLGSKTQLYQAIMNLCVNARDAMPNGGILQIEANTIILDAAFVIRHPPAIPGEYVSLKISDNGVGIPEDVLDRIFDPFFTTKEAGKGTGLGLSTVLGIVKRHGGFLEVTSKIGKGSRFTIYLPTIEPASQAAAPAPSPVLPSGNGRVVLVVDDERVIRDITASTLKKNGYQVLTACDGTEGFALFTQHRSEISVIVTDMSMPYMDGAKMIRALFQIDPKVKVIAMSGLNEEVNLPELLKKKVPFLKKPFALDKLLETLAEVVEAAPAKESPARSPSRLRVESKPRTIPPLTPQEPRLSDDRFGS
ncbi:MAG: response regulator [Verrucomicrobia bacterium]|nr:response regulator [Verrucomicrobiota bacterium]